MLQIKLRSHSSRSQDSSSGGQTSNFTSEMVLCCTLVSFESSPQQPAPQAPKMQQVQVFDEDQLVGQEKMVADTSDVDDNHLARDQERYASYYHSLPLQLQWLKSSPYLAACFDCDTQPGKLYLYTEKWSECFHDIMKLRLANHIKFHEEELVQMLFEVLQGLQQLEQCAHLNVVGEGRVPTQLREPSELLFLNPTNIAVIAKKRNRATQINFKLTNFLEHILLNSETKRKYLLQQIYGSDDAIFYFPPELICQLFVKLQVVESSHDFDFDEECDAKIKPEKYEYLTCMFRGAIWSLGMLILRCFHSRQGDYLALTYTKNRQLGKMQFINELMKACAANPESVFCPYPLEESGTRLQRWLSGTDCPVDEFSWPLRELTRQMLISDVTKRPSASQLLESPLFKGYNTTVSTEHQYESVSLGVFANLTKQDLNHQVADRIFSNEELVQFSKPALKRRFVNVETVAAISLSFSALRSTFATKINQICTIVRQEGVQKMQVDQFLERIGRIASQQHQPPKKQDDDQLSIKSEIVSSKRQSVQLPPPEDSKAKSPPQSNLSNGMLSKMNIFSRVGGGIFTKRSNSPRAEHLNDSQSTFDTQVTVTSQLTHVVAQLLLMKLVASSSERLFRAFLGKSKEFMIMGTDGVFWKGVRKQLWPRALQVENEEAWREVIEFTLEVAYCPMAIKWNDHLQIQKDVPRCHQSNPFANSYYGKLMICRTLQAFINIQPTNFYLQGMDAMVLVLLVAMNYDWQLAVMCLQEFFNRKIVSPMKEIIAQIDESSKELLSDRAFKAAFNKKLQEKLLLYKWILTFQDPAFVAHLESVGFMPEMYVVSWFTNFFAMDFDVGSVIRIWDYLFLSEENFEIFFAVALMCELRETLLLKDSSGTMGCIKNLQSILSIDLCLKYAQHMQSKLPKNLPTLHYTTAEVRQDLHENQFVKDRPWESPPLLEELNERRCFELSVQDLQSLLATNEAHPSYIMMLDFRPLKSYEAECISGSIYTNYLNGKINSPPLMKYLQLKNQVTGSIESFKEEIEPQPILLSKRASPANKPLGFVIVVWDYVAQAQEIAKIQSFMLDMVCCKRLCVLKGGIQAVRVDAEQLLIRKQIKSTLPLFIKKELEDFKTM